jgi:hypothetical protein
VTDDTLAPPIPGTPEANDLVVRGADGDPVPDPRGTRMEELESYERVIEGLRIAADACMHLARHEPKDCETWKSVGMLLDRVRLEATKLAAVGLTMRQQETSPDVRGAPLVWRDARKRFLDGLRQATGGMRQLAVCFRAEMRWALMAGELERRQKAFEALLRPAHPVFGRALRRPSGLILPAHLTRQ